MYTGLVCNDHFNSNYSVHSLIFGLCPFTVREGFCVFSLGASDGLASILKSVSTALFIAHVGICDFC